MKKIIVAALTLGTLASPAFAGDAPDDAYVEIDVNRDDSLSIEEAGAVEGLAEQWDALDIDGDGQLNREEFAKAGISTPVNMPQ
ncbi:MAG: EF-hand domain-containing protein [Gammaproteobacteria bacterium]|jgi:hypothetical protein